VDLSLQALLFRIEQLERRLEGSSGGGAAATAGGGAPADERAGGGSSDRGDGPARRAAKSGGAERETQAATAESPEPAAAAAPREVVASPAGAAAAVATAVEPEPASEPAPAPDASAPEIDIDRLRELWPAVIDAVRSENAMVGACLEGAHPASLEGDRLTIAFPVLAGFSRKTVERNRELLQASLKALTGRALALEYAASDEHVRGDAPVAALSEEELIERLKRDYGATEVFDDEPPPSEEA
jgi:DNA polymerase-3 subunit gamma/tau